MKTVELPQWSAILVAGLAGTGVMILELGAARLLTPYFGQSLYVWTNVIGIVLAALALGSFVGGMIADRFPRPSLLALILGTAALMCACVPFVVPKIAAALMSPELTLELAFEFLAKGSLITTLIVFAPPVVLLGAAVPFLVKFSASSDSAFLGTRAGVIYAASTAGSILGTFLTTYVLIEAFGTRRTFAIASALILASALVAFLPSRRSRRVQVGVLFMIAVSGMSFGLAPEHVNDPSVVYSMESSYQFIRVREKDNGRIRELCLNEALDSFHSVTVNGQISTGAYYDYYNLLAAAHVPSASLDVLILGLAAGTHARQLLAYLGDKTRLFIHGVEIDPDVVRVGHSFLGLPRDPRLEISYIDARAALRFDDRKYDVIIVDVFAQQTYIPFHLATEEFFQLLTQRLKEHGTVGLNVSAFSRQDPVLRALVNTMSHVFGEVAEISLPKTRNYLVHASKDGHPRSLAAVDTSAFHPDLETFRESLSRPGSLVLRTFDPDDVLLSDDHAPIERLEDKVLGARARKMLDPSMWGATK